MYVTSNAIYATLHDGLYKFDWYGRLLMHVSADKHQGDICFWNGKLHTAVCIPKDVPKRGRIDVKGTGGEWTTAFETKENHQRLVRGKIGRECLGIRLMPLSTWGSDLKENTYGSATAHIFAFEPV